MKLDQILFTSDLSGESMQPAQTVADFARSVGAKLVLLHVVEELRVVPHGAPLAPPLSPPDSQKRQAEAKATLEESRAAFGDEIEVEVDVITAEKIAPAVADYAEKKGIDLIALSTHGRTGFRHLALGSVAEAILRHSPVPVITFPQSRK